MDEREEEKRGEERRGEASKRGEDEEKEEEEEREGGWKSLLLYKDGGEVIGIEFPRHLIHFQSLKFALKGNKIRRGRRLG